MTIFSVIPLTAAHIFCNTAVIQAERSTSDEEGRKERGEGGAFQNGRNGEGWKGGKATKKRMRACVHRLDVPSLCPQMLFKIFSPLLPFPPLFFPPSASPLS